MIKTVLVTGGAGYIGSHTVKYLQERNIKCIVLDNLVNGHKESFHSDCFANIDLLDKANLDIVFQKYQIDAVVHFAAYAYVGESVIDPQKYYINNVVGTINLLESMLKYKVTQIVFSSTCATYGSPEYTPIDEDHPQNPINPYGQSKLMIEKILDDYYKAYGLKYIALRYFNAAGCSIDGQIGESHMPETHLIPLVLKAIKKELLSIKIFGTDYDTKDGTCVRDYIHVDDLAFAHYLALEKLNEFVGKINLATGNGLSVKEIIEEAEKITGGKCNIEYTARRSGDPALLYASNFKAKQILSWKPIYSDIETIIKTAWFWECNRKY